MSGWLCSFASECPFLKSPFCGHTNEKPLILSYHPKPPGVLECYIEHVISCWNSWKKLEHRWINSVERILSSVMNVQIDEKYVQEAMDMTIIHHDIGKLTEEYQNQRLIGHEVLSTYLLFYQFKSQFEKQKIGQNESDILASIFSSAVYLHHEAAQIYYGTLEMREPTYSYLLYRFSSLTFHKIRAFNELINQINQIYVPSLASITSSLAQDIQKPIIGSEVVKTLGSIILTVDGYSDPLVMRMGVATVLHPLTICDNLAARRRGGKPPALSRELIELFDEGGLGAWQG